MLVAKRQKKGKRSQKWDKRKYEGQSENLR